MDIFSHFHDVVMGVLDNLSKQGALPAGLDFGNVAVEPPRDPEHGDIALNAAMVLAKQASMPPRELAALLAEELKAVEHIETVEIAGPGFINITLAPDIWPAVLEDILSKGGDYGASNLGRAKKINIEYVSANPTGPMHVGHCRGAVFGDALANLLEKTGFDVTREYYINDAGAQIDILAQSTYLRYREALGEDIGDIPAGLYPGDYLVPVGVALAEKYGETLLAQDETEWLDTLRPFAIEAMMVQIKGDLDALGIKHDVFFSERSMVSETRDLIAESIARLTSKDLVYQGKLPPPKGQPPEDWEDREQTLFKASAFGDDIDRPLLKADGSYTYFAADIAYHNDKINRGFNHMIDVWGADHGGYVKRMQSAVAALSDKHAELEVKLCQLVRLFRAGEPVKMSKRAGEFVTLRDVVSEVGADSVRFMMLYRKNDAPLDFDFAKVSEQSRDNPVFYVQYAHARIHSVLRNAEQLKGAMKLKGAVNVSEVTSGQVDFGLLDHPAERAIVKQLAAYPRILLSAAGTHEPHRIAFYLYEVASSFHSLWNMGKVAPQLRFIAENENVTGARLAFLKAIGHTLASGLAILGVKAVEEMK